jgi:hypothetical protein
MIWVVSALTVVVGVLTLFVLGLLRGYADLREQLAEIGEAQQATSPTSFSTSLPEGVVPAPETMPESQLAWIRGVDSDLEPFDMPVNDLATPYLLVAFLSTGCLTCLDIWRDMIDAGGAARTVTAGPDAASVIIVLKGREHENLGKARALAAETAAPVVFAAEAWTDLEVPGSPYFALVATAGGAVVGAGSAQSWEQLESLATDGMLELSISRAPRTGNGGGYRSIIEREDTDLRRGGVLPGDPSLTAPLLEDENAGVSAFTRTGDS